MMDGRVVGIHMTTVIILLPQKPPLNLQKLKLLVVLQHQHHHQVELGRKQQVVVTQHQHRLVVVQRQMSITLLQVIHTTHHSVQIIQLQPARQLVQHMVVMLHQSNSILVILRWCLFNLVLVQY